MKGDTIIMATIVCKKEDLNFLSQFVFFADTKTPIGNKVKIVTVDGTLYFGMINNSGCLLYTFGKTQDTINSVFDVNVLYSLINTLSNDDTITISESKISINNGIAEYTIAQYDMTIDIESFINYDITQNNVLVLKKLQLIDKIYDFATGQNLEVISLQNKHYVASNRCYVTCAITDDDISVSEQVFYFDKKFIKLLQLINANNDIVLYYNSEKYCVHINNFTIITPVKASILPYIFSEEIQKKINLPYVVKVNINALKLAVQRLKNVVSDKTNCVYITITENGLLLENKDGMYAYENVPLLSKSDCLISHVYSVSLTYLYAILQKLNTETIIIKMTNVVQDSVCITLHDDDYKSLYVLMLLEK